MAHYRLMGKSLSRFSGEGKYRPHPTALEYVVGASVAVIGLAYCGLRSLFNDKQKPEKDGWTPIDFFTEPTAQDQPPLLPPQIEEPPSDPAA